MASCPYPGFRLRAHVARSRVVDGRSASAGTWGVLVLRYRSPEDALSEVGCQVNDLTSGRCCATPLTSRTTSCVHEPSSAVLDRVDGRTMPGCARSESGHRALAGWGGHAIVAGPRGRPGPAVAGPAGGAALAPRRALGRRLRRAAEVGRHACADAHRLCA